MRTSEMPLASRAVSVDPDFDPNPRSEEVLASPDPGGGPCLPTWTFDSVYHSHASFVWRNARRLGLARSAAEDVMQDVFLVVYRRLPDFEERTSLRAWLSAILIRVVRAHRRALHGKHGAGGHPSADLEPDQIIDPRTPSPVDRAERDEAIRELQAILSSMNEARREVFVLSELEELTAPEIAHALGVNINTVYWRLRTARREFERILFRRRAAEMRSPR
jgi:RNA polymerase sigma-70 factor (ECF subfamily)